MASWGLCYDMMTAQIRLTVTLMSRLSDGMLMCGVVNLWYATSCVHYDFAGLNDTHGSLLWLADAMEI